MFEDKTITRMTIVYEDGSLTILTRNEDGTMNVERRKIMIIHGREVKEKLLQELIWLLIQLNQR